MGKRLTRFYPLSLGYPQITGRAGSNIIKVPDTGNRTAFQPPNEPDQHFLKISTIRIRNHHLPLDLVCGGAVLVR
jgi:hypothetical protein